MLAGQLTLVLSRGFFLTGAPLTICVIEIPQRFQTVNGSSPIGAGVKLLAYALSNPVGGFICSGAAGRLRVPFVYILLAGIALQIVGVFLLSEIPDSIELWAGQFGYTVLAGLGVGMAGAAFYMMVPLVVEEYDQSIALGTGLQLRMFGGALGIAIVTTIMNSYLKSHLPALLSPEQLSAVLDSAQVVATFPSELQVQVRQVYARAYNMQMKATWAFSIAQLLPVLLLWKKQQVRFLRHDQYEEL